MKHHHRGVAYSCPNCEEKIDHHHSVNSEAIQPGKGDVLVCAYCKAILEVIEPRQGIAKMLTAEEFNALPGYLTKTLALVIGDWENQKKKALE